MTHKRPTIADLAAYDEIIDVRSPAEFAEDHIPGAINCPVLDNAQRAEVGTLYKQVSPFEAKKIGAALISENIARHLRERFLDRPKHWKPLIYCWRGGERSGAMSTVFRSIGWSAGHLDGGYKSWRRHVVERLEHLPRGLRFDVVCGPTGSAKTRILQAIARRGEQVLDLETLACHKGSVLGLLPEQTQPPQKWFETLILQQLSAFDPNRPIYVEAESRKIGSLYLPEALIAGIRAGRCIDIAASREARVAFLLEDYDYFPKNPGWLATRLEALSKLHRRETIQTWLDLIEQQDWPTLVHDLLAQHYDPLYQRSHAQSFGQLAEAKPIQADDLSPDGIDRLAEHIVHLRRAQIA